VQLVEDEYEDEDEDDITKTEEDTLPPKTGSATGITKAWSFSRPGGRESSMSQDIYSKPPHIVMIFPLTHKANPPILTYPKKSNVRLDSIT
jgi:hypothetical protein